MILKGQECTWNKDKNFFLINIDSPFEGAGVRYGWDGDPVGVGINIGVVRVALQEKADICIRLGSDPTLYFISPVDVIKFCRQYKSFYRAKGVLLFVVRKTEFLPYYGGFNRWLKGFIHEEI